METWAEIDGWLREGGLVVTSSDRAARALQSTFHRRRRAEGLTAWPAPEVHDWKSFARSTWEERSLDGRLILNSAQEQTLWADIIRDAQHLATVIPASIHRLAEMAMDAYELLCFYSPQCLREAARKNWDRDAEAFSRWLSAFETTCAKQNLLSMSRLPLELVSALRSDSASRPPLRVAGFDRLLPVQQELFNAWGEWQQFSHGDAAREIRFYLAPDRQAELAACARWCRRQIAADPRRLLVVTQQISERRGEIERAFLRLGKLGSVSLFEFTLGIPLSQVALARGAGLLLRWLDGAIEENEVDWLFSSEFAATQAESAALQACMRAIRRRGLQQTHWTVQNFVRSNPGPSQLPESWVRRMHTAQRQLQEFASKPQGPLAWADKIPQLLDTMGWPGGQARASAEFQAHRRWQQALDTAGSLGFDGRRINWNEFLSSLDRAMAETLFSPQSLDAPIQIAGPAESAGLTADAIWFLGADEESWPTVGTMNPFLPPQIQRDVGLPYSSPARAWELANAITNRLIASASEVHFSYAAQRDTTEARPSRLIAQIAGAPQPMPAELAPASIKSPETVVFPDFSRVPFQQESAPGGSAVLSSQSQCPFKAFAVARLDAKDWEPAEVGLTASERGQLLHSVLHAVWGANGGLRSSDDLRVLEDVETYVRNHVQQVMRDEVPRAVRESMPQRYLELEEKRLLRVVAEWLAYEAKRAPFTVTETESERVIHLAGLTLKLRLDRIDRLKDDSLLVIDYKTGHVSPKAWDLPRPDDVQPPLYKVFGLEQTSTLSDHRAASGGLVFAKIRPGDTSFAGYVANPIETIDPGLDARNALRRHRLTAAKEADWRAAIEQLAMDFVEGRAEVDPREFPTTCERCGLHAVCRVLEPENQDRLRFEDNQESDNE